MGFTLTPTCSTCPQGARLPDHVCKECHRQTVSAAMQMVGWQTVSTAMATLNNSRGKAVCDPNSGATQTSGWDKLAWKGCQMPTGSPPQAIPSRLPSVHPALWAFAQHPPQGHLPGTRQDRACSCPHPSFQGQQPQGEESCAPALFLLPPGTTLILCCLGMRPGSRSQTQPWTGPQRSNNPLTLVSDCLRWFNDSF